MKPSSLALPPDETAAAEDLRVTADAAPVRFGYFDPDASEVFLAGTFNAWAARELPLTRDATGNWSLTLALPPGEYQYRLIVDGTWRDHPGAARWVAGPFGGNNAVVTV